MLYFCLERELCRKITRMIAAVMTHGSSDGNIASEVLADIEGKLEKMSKLSRYDSYN